MKALIAAVNVVLNPAVLLAIALVAGGIGVFLVLDSPAYAQRRERAERLAPVSAANLTDAPPGQEVLVEGSVSPRNPAVHREFVAYVLEEYRDKALDGDSTESWVEVERATPPLIVLVRDGEARIANDDYTFDTTAVTVEEAKPTFTKGAVQSRGYVAGSPVLAIGKVVAGGGVEAEFLYAGTRDAYREEMARMARRTLPVGLAFLLVGVAALAGGAWQLRRFLREIAAERVAEEESAQAQQAQMAARRKGKRARS
jgi:hypothetical protein